MMALTIYALFGDDIRLAGTDLSADDAFSGLTTCCLFFFSVEIILSCLLKEGYWLSFFFWLDLVSTVSLITDIQWIWNEMVGTSGSGTKKGTQATKIARAGRASRAGTRAARVIRVIRVIRLIRIAKLYKIAKSQALQNTTSEVKLKRAQVTYRGGEEPIINSIEVSSGRIINSDNSNMTPSSRSQSFGSMSEEINTKTLENNNLSKIHDSDEEEADINIPEESKVGKKLSELTTKRVIILVLGMMIMLPFFVSTFYQENNTSYEYGLEVIDKLVAKDGFDDAFDLYVSKHRDIYTPLIYLEVPSLKNWTSSTDSEDLRSTEQTTVVLPGVDDDYEYISYAIFDIRSSTRLEAGLNILKTIFICVVLSVSSVLLSKDAQDMVLEPIEAMIESVKNISKNPLKAVQIAENEEYLKKEMSLSMVQNEKKKEKKEKKEKTSMETIFLKETINKIAMLLALGFGEAGSEIIVTNMQKGGGEVDPMIPGKRTHCIFGFCDIRNFTDATEILEEEVMGFVNEIANIVHSQVDYFSGVANKNIGDAFLLV